MGLERGLQAVGPVTIRTHAAGERVHDADASVLDEVVGIAIEQRAGMERAVHLGQQRLVSRVVQGAAREGMLDLLEPGVGQLDVVAVFVGGVVHAGRERGHQRREYPAPAGRADHPPGDDERHTGLVDEERIGFVDQREASRPVYGAASMVDQLVTQEVEPRFLRGHIRDVGGVGAPPRPGVHPLLHGAHRQAEQAIDRAHPLGVATGEVVVEREDMGTAAVERVECRRHRGGERLALSGVHLDHRAAVERERGHDLLVVRPLAERPACRLARECEELGPRLGTRAPGACRADRLCPYGERGVGQPPQRRLVRGHRVERGVEGGEREADVRPAGAVEQVAPANGVPRSAWFAVQHTFHVSLPGRLRASGSRLPASARV